MSFSQYFTVFLFALGMWLLIETTIVSTTWRMERMDDGNIIKMGMWNTCIEYKSKINDYILLRPVMNYMHVIIGLSRVEYVIAFMFMMRRIADDVFFAACTGMLASVCTLGLMIRVFISPEIAPLRPTHDLIQELVYMCGAWFFVFIFACKTVVKTNIAAVMIAAYIICHPAPTFVFLLMKSPDVPARARDMIPRAAAELTRFGGDSLIYVNFASINECHSDGYETVMRSPEDKQRYLNMRYWSAFAVVYTWICALYTIKVIYALIDQRAEQIAIIGRARNRRAAFYKLFFAMPLPLFVNLYFAYEFMKISYPGEGLKPVVSLPGKLILPPHPPRTIAFNSFISANLLLIWCAWRMATAIDAIYNNVMNKD